MIVTSPKLLFHPRQMFYNALQASGQIDKFLFRDLFWPGSIRFENVSDPFNLLFIVLPFRIETGILNSR